MLLVRRTSIDVNVPYSIDADEDADAYRIVRVGSFVNMRWYEIRNSKDEVECKISRRRFNFLPRFLVHAVGFGEIVVEKDMASLHTLYSVSGAGMSSKGSWEAGEDFSIERDGRPIARCAFGQNGALSMVPTDSSVVPAVLGIGTAICMMRAWDAGQGTE